jgi:hypothetical protein
MQITYSIVIQLDENTYVNNSRISVEKFILHIVNIH